MLVTSICSLFALFLYGFFRRFVKTGDILVDGYKRNYIFLMNECSRHSDGKSLCAPCNDMRQVTGQSQVLLFSYATLTGTVASALTGTKGV